MLTNENAGVPVISSLKVPFDTVHACFRGIARDSTAPMACAVPFRPWFHPAPRVFESRTARGQSTNPLPVLSCTYAPPQRFTPKSVAPPRESGRTHPRFEAPRFAPRPFSISKRKNPSFHPATAGRLESRAVLSKSPARRVWLPSRRRQLSRPRRPVSAPNAHGLRSPELSSDPMACPGFPPDTPFLRFCVKPIGLTPALQRLTLTGPAVHPAREPVSRPARCRCSPELFHLPGLLPPDPRRSTFLLRSPHALRPPAHVS
jgi:hypothetical protein